MNRLMDLIEAYGSHKAHSLRLAQYGASFKEQLENEKELMEIMRQIMACVTRLNNVCLKLDSIECNVNQNISDTDRIRLWNAQEEVRALLKEYEGHNYPSDQ